MPNGSTVRCRRDADRGHTPLASISIEYHHERIDLSWPPHDFEAGEAILDAMTSAMVGRTIPVG